MNVLLLGALGLGLGMLALSKQKPNGIPEQGILTFETGDVTGTNYMVMLGDPGVDGRQLVSVYNTNEELVLLFVQSVDGTNRSVVNSQPNPNLSQQSAMALRDFKFRS